MEELRTIKKRIRIRKSWTFEVTAEVNGEREVIIYGPPETHVDRERPETED